MSFNVIYPTHDGARFDANYYRSSHIPLVMKVMKATSVLLIEGVPMGSSPAPFAMIAHFKFASSEAIHGCSRQSSDDRGPGRCRQVHRHQADGHAGQVAVGFGEVTAPYDGIGASSIDSRPAQRRMKKGPAPAISLMTHVGGVP